MSHIHSSLQDLYTLTFEYIGKVLSPVKTNEMGYIKSSFQNVKVRPKPKTDKTAGPADLDFNSSER